ncbi:NAD(P)-dependent oxidoreductase [Pelagibius marinus]|uniref:NAD(P)-dependent oxidoreductase n=1 Tax=Pelagibius marinus TaxID=2762760 RepID=UPI0018726CF5|nr:NAD(P)-dependent oxidoreductase [Pelagibius marinus]
MSTKIGFIGVGLMGHGIAKNLLEKGYPVTAMAHRNRAPLEDLLARGAQEAATPKAIAEAADVVMICVTGAPQVEAIVYGENGLLQGLRDGQTVIDCTTNLPAMTERLAADFAAHGVTLVDGPLALTPKEAEEGKLNCMIGASDEVFAMVKPIFECFCQNIVHTGPTGSAIKVKLIYNFLAMGIVGLIAETMCAVAAAGIDKQRFYDIISAGGANCGIFQRIITRAMESGDYDGLMFSVANAAKDLTYYTRMTEDFPLTGNLGNAVQHAFLQAKNMGLGDDYVGALMTAQSRLNGVEIFKT